MLIRRFAVCAAMVVTTVALTVAHASATGAPTLQCGVNPTTSVQLESDLTCASSFVIGDSSASDPITIDLGGHTLTITNPDAPCRFGLPGTKCAVFGTGPVGLVNGTVQGSIGLASVRGPNSLYRLSVVGDVWMSGVGGRAIQTMVTGSVRAFSSTFALKYSTIRNGGVSFNDLDTRMAIDIDFNQIVHSPDAAIAGVLGQGGEFQNDVTGHIDHNIITGPTGAGISLTGALTNIGQLDLTGDRVLNSGADGIHIVGVATPPTPYLGGPVTLTQNSVIQTVGQGINAPWVTNLVGTAIVDGGQNLARHTGQFPRCVGVVCLR
jgi:hypothetical protein